MTQRPAGKPRYLSRKRSYRKRHRLGAVGLPMTETGGTALREDLEVGKSRYSRNILRVQARCPSPPVPLPDLDEVARQTSRL